MAQVKKASIEKAILEAADTLFMSKGYSATTLGDIAAQADVTVSNIYNYFKSKIEIVFAIYEPWLDARLDALAVEAAAISDPRQRLRTIIVAVLRDIPVEKNGFVNNLLQAIITRSPDEPYSTALLLRSEAKLSAMMRDALSDGTRLPAANDALSHLLFMAFDGFAISYRLNGSPGLAEAVTDMLCDLILATTAYDTLVGAAAMRRSR